MARVHTSSRPALLSPWLAAMLFLPIVPAWAAAGRARAGTGRTEQAGTRVISRQRGTVRLDYDLSAGMASLSWAGVPRLAGFHSAVRLGELTISSRDYAHRSLSTSGREIVVTLTGSGLPTMRQRFSLKDDGGASHALVRVEVIGTRLSSNWMAPIVVEGDAAVSPGGPGDVRALKVPFDNDRFVRYDAVSLSGPATTGTSHEVAAFYENASRRGLVVGSVTHDTWKTGITFTGAGGRLSALTVFGGAADTETRDVVPHGAVVGDRLLSPKVFVAYGGDWRDELERYAEANAAETPPLRWRGGVPFGWNSWGKIQNKLRYDTAVAVSDAIRAGLQDRGFANDGTAYVNLDSWWDNLKEGELRDFVRHVRANGQRAGIYWTPFAYWLGDLTRPVEGSAFTYGDIALRDGAGKPIVLNGGIALDPTHPGTLKRIDLFMDRFKRLGFEFIKLDFMNNGAVEGGSRNGMHYDPTVTTGIQAYNVGMRRIMRRLGGRMFISLSIAPLFPYQYAHARRVACDTFGAIHETAYLMNSQTYGWWMSGRLYAFNDPDHMVLEDFTPAENRSRVTSAAIAGTVYLNGDDLSRPAARRRAAVFLTNRAVNDVARRGRAFRPVEGDTGSGPADVMMLDEGDSGYLAVFNYNGQSAATKTVDLARAGLDGATAYTVTDLWSGARSTATGRLTVRLRPGESTLLLLVPRVLNP